MPLVTKFWLGKFLEDLFFSAGMAAWTFFTPVTARAPSIGGRFRCGCLDLHQGVKGSQPPAAKLCGGEIRGFPTDADGGEFWIGEQG